ncbi:hypothetical protein ACIOUE_00970 [Streptomyces xanthochromogenes]|uniref:hypothetical protein n=1 Tax=Streptomyces xanthochromogenes TaxID=67384 RepID=UPI003820AC90
MTTSASGPTCAACTAAAVVHWTRRLTDEEFAAFVALEQARRDLETALADPQKPPPTFGPLPAESDNVRTIYACIDHAISLEAAALVHEKTCTAPPCNCTPEPAPQPEPDPEPVQLPPGWIDA